MQCLFSMMFSFLLNQREKVLSCLATECAGVLLQYSIMGDKNIKQSKAKNNRPLLGMMDTDPVRSLFYYLPHSLLTFRGGGRGAPLCI